MNGRLEDVKGTVVTSTPGTGTESEKVKVGKDEKRQDEDSESKDDEVSVGVEKKKRTSKNRRHEWLMNKRGVSIDSLYGSVDGSGRNNGSESGEQSRS